MKNITPLQNYINQFDYELNKFNDYSDFEIPIKDEILDILQGLFDLVFTIKMFCSEDDIKDLDHKYTNLFNELSILHKRSIDLDKQKLLLQIDKGNLLNKIHSMHTKGNNGNK